MDRKISIHSWKRSGEPKLLAFKRNRSGTESEEVKAGEAAATDFIKRHESLIRLDCKTQEFAFLCKFPREPGDNDIYEYVLSDEYEEFKKNNPGLFIFGFVPRHTMVEVDKQEVLRNLHVYYMREEKEEYLTLKKQIEQIVKDSYMFFSAKEKDIRCKYAKRIKSLNDFDRLAKVKNISNPVIGLSFELISNEIRLLLIGNLPLHKRKKYNKKVSLMQEKAKSILTKLRSKLDDPAEAIESYIRSVLDIPIEHLSFSEDRFIDRDGLYHTLHYDADYGYYVKYEDIDTEAYNESLTWSSRFNTAVSYHTYPTFEDICSNFKYDPKNYIIKENRHKPSAIIDPIFLGRNDDRQGRHVGICEYAEVCVCVVRTNKEYSDINHMDRMKLHLR